ncbi:hypothetical protein M2352_003815 [Azospirillum fermentarium]|uniref:DUF4231 domain-containing protein n=1 Tax=Azospirillum fermentarium TaxID=1233114 RepID=UPI00222757C5|nr:DUF4231 domain-containing protein [Azospirillum fermentarium]MCW2248181.1 hypothetical protein [Azospirillum fermentarium]
MNDIVVQQLWDDHIGWSKTADLLKARRTAWRTVVLTLTVAGAALQTFAAVVGPGVAKISLGSVGAASLTLVPFLGSHFLGAERTGKWLRARSISEGIKSEIYSFRAKSSPYDQPGAINILSEKVKEFHKWAGDLSADRSRILVTGDAMPPELDADTYIKQRVEQQIREYYKPKARENACLAERFRVAEIVLAGLAAVTGTVATTLGDPVSANLGPWVAVLTTIASSIAAHSASSRFDFQATTFAATAQQLEDLVRDWRLAPAPVPSQEWSGFVKNCESVISAENRAWMAKLQKDT